MIKGFMRSRRSHIWICATVILILSACGGGEEGAGTEEVALESRIGVGPQAPQRLGKDDGLFTIPNDTIRANREQSRSVGGFSVDLSQREAARLFYTTVYKASDGVSSEWTGSLSGCVPGDTSAGYKEAVLRRINWFRAMAGLPASVQFDATFNRKAQQAALVMAANNKLSHTPPPAWTCNNVEATEAANSSNLSLGRAGSDSIASGYMEDSGSNNTAVGHRRWILYPQTQTMGTGDVTGSTRANALWVFDNRFSATRPNVRDEFVAWPPPGYVPFTTVYPRWSFSYPKADFSSATVSMSENGIRMATRKESLSDGAGENTLVWLPGAYTDGMTWLRPVNDTTYVVQISGVRINGATRNFNYTVKVFDPDVSNQGLSLSGGDTAVVGQSAYFSFPAVPGATSYQWRSLQSSPASFADGAEGELSQFSATTSSGYNVQQAGVAASGSRSFHLAHPQPVDQVLAIESDWVPTAQTTLRFASRLGLASSNQRARAELSQDGGTNWIVLFEQAGTESGTTSSSGETAFNQKQISLAPYEGRTIKLRFRYSVVGGSYYPQTSNTAGWFIDDISLEAINRLTHTGQPTDIGSSTQFSVIPTQVGGLLLQARPGMFGSYADWGAIKQVMVENRTGAPVLPPASISAAAIDCLFNWAQREFPDVLRPATAPSQTVSPFRFRFYEQTGIYLGVSLDHQQFYYIQSGQLTSLGAVADWFAVASCAAP